MKCAFIASYYGPYYSNFVASMIALEKKMQENGDSVFYIFPEETRNFGWINMLKEYNSNIYFLNYNPHSLQNVMALKYIFKKENVDIIYSHMCGWDFTARFAAPFKPVVWHMHMNVNVNDRIKRIKNWIKFNILGFGRTYHIAAAGLVAKAINSLKPRNRCVTIYNALDFSRLKISNKKEESECKKILIFGWEPIVKGLDIALDACEKLIEEGKKIKLQVSSQEKTYKYIDQRYETLPEWLELIGPTNDVSVLYNNADIMLSASRSEGFSYALAEAIYSGLVTVTSDIAGTAWSKEFDGRFEFISGDCDSLKFTLLNALGYTISADEQNKNREKFKQKYSMDIWADSVYNELKLIYNKQK